jgi:hypothetical protein
MAESPEDHARQVVMITSIISEAFAAEGMRCTLVGGSAIEVHVPGIFKSGDIDLVIEQMRGSPSRDQLDPVFQSLGFRHVGRHWTLRDLLVEVPSMALDDPSVVVKMGPFVLRVIAKETLLADRIVGFKEWRQTSYAQQAIDMMAAFGDDLRLDILTAHLKREGALDAFDALRAHIGSELPVTEEALQSILERLTGR